MKKVVAFMICVITSGILYAEETLTFTTREGKEFTDVHVSKVEPDGITVLYSAGIAKIKFESLPEEIQNKFNYDAKAAKAYSEEVERKKNEKIKQAAEDYAKSETGKTENKVKSSSLGKDVVVQPDAVKKQGFKANLKVHSFMNEYTFGDITEDMGGGQTEFAGIIGIFGTCNAGDLWKGTLYPCGTCVFREKIVNKSGKTLSSTEREVLCYATTLELALKKLNKK